MKVVGDGNCFLDLFQILSMEKKTTTLSVGYDAFMSWFQTISNTQAMSMYRNVKHTFQIPFFFFETSILNGISKSLKN